MDLQALKEAAEGAQASEPWEAVDVTDNVVSPSELADYEATTGVPAERMWWVKGVPWLDQDELTEGLWMTEATAHFIVTANPATILALVERLDAANDDTAQDYRDRYELVRDAATYVQEVCFGSDDASQINDAWANLASVLAALARQEASQ